MDAAGRLSAASSRGFAVALVAAAAGLGGCGLFDFSAEARATRMLEYEKLALDRVQLGMARFVFDDFGGLNTYTLETNAIAWKPVATALVVEASAREGLPITRETLAQLLRRHGWITPGGIDNWSGLPPPRLDAPLGLVTGEIRRAVPKIRLEVANVGCAACHAGMRYGADGEPTGRVWLGAPNTSRDFDGYLRAIVAALRYAKERPERLLEAVPKLFPDVHPDELATIRDYVLPRIFDRLDEPDGSLAALLSFRQGGPGITNGVAALKLRLNEVPSLLGRAEHGYTSVPDLHGRALRSSFLYDGFYSPDPAARYSARAAGARDPLEPDRVASIVAYFLVPTMGVHPDAPEAQASRVRDTLAFLDGYRPPPFPGPIDARRAARGADLYAKHCAECHGTYSAAADGLHLAWFPNRLVPQSAMHTDPERWRAITPELVRALAARPVASKLHPAAAQGYVAPILNGLWASAPYLHNGSVPTLWHLMRPGERPRQFLVGGHRLDYRKVGIDGAPDGAGVYRYREGYRPWSTPVLYDTTQPGKSNAGHEAEFAPLSDAEKDDLLEFLKQL